MSCGVEFPNHIINENYIKELLTMLLELKFEQICWGLKFT